MTTVKESLLSAIRTAGQFTAGDQTAPCAILWPDPERRWECIIDALKETVPELFVLGVFSPERRTGPAIWLRCIVERTVENAPAAGLIPIIYLPGVSRQQLRDTEVCPFELQPLVEMQFRGTVWNHPNGKDWTPTSFLSSDRTGLGLDVAKGDRVDDALQRAYPCLLNEKTESLKEQRIDVAYLNDLLAPDLPRRVLRWLDNQNAIKKDSGEWIAFCDLCKKNIGFDPERDGALAAAELLGKRIKEWDNIWQRFVEAPTRYPGVVKLLEQATPSNAFEQNSESWPAINDEQEKALAAGLKALRDKPHDKAVEAVCTLEQSHGVRRNFVWRELGRSPLAEALEHLNTLAGLVGKPLAASSVDALGECYTVTGWKVDAAAINALACCANAEQAEPVCTAVLAIYGQWIEASAHNLQAMKKREPDSLRPKLTPVEPADGRVILFADGLRFDIARMLATRLEAEDLQADLGWDWSAFPAVTATAKPHVAPIAHLVESGPADEQFGVTIKGTEQKLTSDRFRKLITDLGMQVLDSRASGDPTGRGWTEYGTLDKQGHEQGWKIARVIRQELDDLTARIQTLLSAGWKEVVVVTDHGWLLLPGGLPKIDIPKYLTVERWGRCAMLKDTAISELQTVPWHWNNTVPVAVPPGIGCFVAGSEYAHGGISVQEMVVPRISVRASGTGFAGIKIVDMKWTGLRCKVKVAPFQPGLKVDVRAKPADGTSSKVDGGSARDVGADGTVSLPIADGDYQGMAAVVVLLSPVNKVLHSIPTVIGV